MGRRPYLLGPYAEGDPNTEVVRPRNIQLLPSHYAAMLVHRERVSPRMAYRELAGAFQADGNMEACEDILAWLRVACTCRGGGGALANTPVVLVTLPPVHLPKGVYDYVNSKITSDLPALRSPVDPRLPAPAADAGNLVEVVRALTGRSLTSGDDRAPKTIEDAYKETYSVLLRYNRVDGAGAVAPVWKRLANAHKSEQQTILQQEFAKVCTTRAGLAAELYCPVITTALKQMIISFNFAGVGPDDLARAAIHSKSRTPGLAIIMRPRQRREWRTSWNKAPEMRTSRTSKPSRPKKRSAFRMTCTRLESLCSAMQCWSVLSFGSGSSSACPR